METGNIQFLLRELRLKNGYTQQQVADVLRCCRSTYTYYETGKTKPDIDTTLLLSRIYNVPVGMLLNEETAQHRLSDSRRPHKREHTNTSHIFDLSERELALVGAFRACSNKEQLEFLRDALTKRREKGQELKKRESEESAENSENDEKSEKQE